MSGVKEEKEVKGRAINRGGDSDIRCILCLVINVFHVCLYSQGVS